VLISQYQRQNGAAGQCEGCHQYALTCDEQTAAHLATIDLVSASYAKFQQGNTSQAHAVDTAAFSIPEFTDQLHTNETTIHALFEHYNRTTLLPGLASMLPSLASILQQARANIHCLTCPVLPPDDACRVSGGECVGQSDIPDAVKYIVGSQAGLFASFGLVQLTQLLLATQVHGGKAAHRAWHRVSLAYAVLSISTKTVLEVGFIIMLTQMPESRDRPDGGE